MGLAVLDPKTTMADLHKINLRKFSKKKKKVNASSDQSKKKKKKTDPVEKGITESEVVPIIVKFLACPFMKNILTKTSVALIERQKISVVVVKLISYVFFCEIGRMYPHVTVYFVDPVSYRAAFGIRVGGDGMSRSQSHSARKNLSLFGTDVMEEEDRDRVIEAFTAAHVDPVDALLMATYYVSNSIKVENHYTKSQTELIIDEEQPCDFVVTVESVRTNVLK